MNTVTYEEKIHEIVSVFKDKRQLQEAIDELISSGFNPAYISLLADERTVKAKIGNSYRIEELADNPQTPRADYIADENIGVAQGGIIGGLTYVTTLAAASAVIASGGSTSSLLAAAALAGGASSAVGAILGKIIARHHADYLEQQLAHGGLLLWIKIDSEKADMLAQKILRKYEARDIHCHEIMLG